MPTSRFKHEPRKSILYLLHTHLISSADKNITFWYILDSPWLMNSELPATLLAETQQKLSFTKCKPILVS